VKKGKNIRKKGTTKDTKNTKKTKEKEPT